MFWLQIKSSNKSVTVLSVSVAIVFVLGLYLLHFCFLSLA